MAILSILIPVYNEGATIQILLNRVCQAPLPPDIRKEIIVVDDCSTDDTGNSIGAFIKIHGNTNIRYVRHPENRGKGAALHTAIRMATGDYIITQDADLEYDPREYSLLLSPVHDGHADVVYGSRFAGGNPHRVLFFSHTIGNKLLTFLSNLFSGLNLTDMETGYKLFRTEVLRSVVLTERRFGFEPEVTHKISRIHEIRIYEVGISYYGRNFQDGKKINWKDGFRAIYCILKYGILCRRIERNKSASCPRAKSNNQPVL